VSDQRRYHIDRLGDRNPNQWRTYECSCSQMYPYSPPTCRFRRSCLWSLFTAWPTRSERTSYIAALLPADRRGLGLADVACIVVPGLAKKRSCWPSALCRRGSVTSRADAELRTLSLVLAPFGRSCDAGHRALPPLWQGCPIATVLALLSLAQTWIKAYNRDRHGVPPRHSERLRTNTSLVLHRSPCLTPHSKSAKRVFARCRRKGIARWRTPC